MNLSNGLVEIIQSAIDDCKNEVQPKPLAGKFNLKGLDMIFFINTVQDLTVANFLTGQWDNRRFQLCKKDYTDFTEDDKKFLYNTEKMSRKNVEDRAVCRNKLEDYFQREFND